MFKISVIVPVYNAESTLKTAVESVTVQTFGFENIELILVDDNSSDGSKEIIMEYANKYDNVKAILLKENSGSPSHPRNVGVENASAPYLMFLDNDDEFFEDYCEVMYEKITNNDVDIVHCEHASKLNNRLYIPDYIENINLREEYLTKTKKMTINHYAWSNIFRSSLIKENCIKFPKTLYEDGVFSISCYLKTDKPVINLPDFPGYSYLIENENSISHKVNMKTLTGFFEGYNLCADILDKHGCFDAKHELFKGYINMALFILMKLDDVDEGIIKLYEFENSLDFMIHLTSKPLETINNKIMGKKFIQAKFLIKSMGFFYNNKKIRNYLFVKFSSLKLLRDQKI